MLSDDLTNIGTAQALAHNVLLVEDDTTEAADFKRLLEGRGHSVSIAKNGGQAFSSFIMRKPDFVILDLILPGESGFEVCDRLKQANDRVPVLVLSAIDLEDARKLAQRVGADGYLTKPCDPQSLFQTIDDLTQAVWERTHLDKPRVQERVRFSCECGKRFKVSPVHRGRTLTCPDCGETLVIPRHN